MSTPILLRGGNMEPVEGCSYVRCTRCGGSGFHPPVPPYTTVRRPCMACAGLLWVPMHGGCTPAFTLSPDLQRVILREGAEQP